MSQKIIHYNLDEIDKKGALINLIYGERSNGKSYQVKHKKGVLNFLQGGVCYHSDYTNKEVIKDSIKKGTRFILLRRWREEISTDKVEAYFADVDIFNLTNGEYNSIVCYRKALYLANYNIETCKTKKGEKIGYVCSLSTEQNYAGGSYLDVSDIIFEEFMTRTTYLPNEPDKLMNFYSTIDRKRGTTRIWLVGNTISKVCPYLQEWDLDYLIHHQKQGEIVEKWLPTGEIIDNIPVMIKIAIEYCKSTGASSFAIGKHKNMLNKGTWQTDPQPQLPKSKKEYKILYRLGFWYKGFKFLCEYLQDKQSKDCCWFIFPYSKSFNEKTLIFSDIIKTSKYYQRDIYNPSIKNEKLILLLRTFKENKIFYSNDMTGTDFKQVIDFEIRR